MAKDSFYFQHDYNARNDEKILELRATYGPEGYGIFWMIVETMAENENGGVKASNIGGLSLGYGVAKGRLTEVIQSCIDVGLFYETDGYLFSKRLLTYKEFRKSLSNYGKEGAKKKWGGYRGANSTPNANNRIGKNRIEKESRGINFSGDGLMVVFSDGTTQPLSMEQQRLLKDKSLEPHYIIKGEIE